MSDESEFEKFMKQPKYFGDKESQSAYCRGVYDLRDWILQKAKDRAMSSGGACFDSNYPDSYFSVSLKQLEELLK